MTPFGLVISFSITQWSFGIRTILSYYCPWESDCMIDLKELLVCAKLMIGLSAKLH